MIVAFIVQPGAAGGAVTASRPSPRGGAEAPAVPQQKPGQR